MLSDVMVMVVESDRDGGGDVGWAGAGNNGDGGDCSVLGIINYTLCKITSTVYKRKHMFNKGNSNIDLG